MTDVRTFPVLEIFGPTVQGEGLSIGQVTSFVRTAGCDYRCLWCDSAFTWDGSAKDEIRMLTSEQVLAELRQLSAHGELPAHVTVSGGNPALLRDLGELIDRLHQAGVRVALETQGSVFQPWFVDIDELTLSPKPPSSGMSTDYEILDEIIARVSITSQRPGLSVKMVIFDERDLEYSTAIHQRYPDVPCILQVGNAELSSELTVDEHRTKLLERYEWLVDRVKQSPQLRDVRVLPQLHTLLWGNRRGV